MSKTFDSIVVLKTVSITVAFAFAMLSLGMPFWQFAHAANVTDFSNTLSDSAPSAAADHTIVFTTPSGMADTETLTVTLEDFGAVNDITNTDVEIEINGASSTDFTFASTATTLEFTANGTSIAASDEVTINVGTQVGGTNQITNPASTGSYPVQVDVAGVDSGETRVAIIDSVEVTASVDTVFTFTIAGVIASSSVNGATTTGETTATAVPFGTLEPGTASTTAQDLTVETNASNGFAVTVQTDQALQSSTGAEIQGFVDGSNTTTPTAWASPAADVQDPTTWGHWGLTTEDTDLTFGSGNYVAASTTPVIVFENDGPADGSTEHIGATRVGYKIEISALQPAGDDYTTTLTYIATPVF